MDNSEKYILSKLKISDLLSKNNQKFYGVEISSKLKNIPNYEDFKTKPLFTSLVWDDFSNSTLKLVNSIELNQEIVLPHISCYQMTTQKLIEIFSVTNFSNILIIRGDLIDPNQEFKYASDMVKKIKEIKKDSISIGVCGYPDKHPDAISIEDDLKQLKMKVESGADFIVTQICFSSEQIIKFIKNCRSIGINQPIIPGIFTPTSWTILKKMIEFTKVPIDNELLLEFEKFKDDDEKFKEFSFKIFNNIVKDLFKNNDINCNCIHFFTFNHFDITQKIVNDLF